MAKVMLVEDESLVRLALRSLINWEDYDIDISYEAENGKQALQLLDKNPDIDIIITDINMPVMNGLELIEEVNKIDKAPYIIVLSAYDDYQLVRQAFKIGIKDYILKSEMEPDQVLSLLQKVIKEKVIKKDNEEFNLKIAKSHFIGQLLYGNVEIINDNDVNKYGIRFNKNNIMCFYIWIDGYNLIKQDYQKQNLNIFMNSVLNCIHQVLDEEKNGEVVSLSPEE